MRIPCSGLKSTPLPPEANCFKSKSAGLAGPVRPEKVFSFYVYTHVHVFIIYKVIFFCYVVLLGWFPSRRYLIFVITTFLQTLGNIASIHLIPPVKYHVIPGHLFPVDLFSSGSLPVEKFQVRALGRIDHHHHCQSFHFHFLNISYHLWNHLPDSWRICCPCSSPHSWLKMS